MNTKSGAKYGKPGSNSKGRKPGKKPETDWAKEDRLQRKKQNKKVAASDKLLRIQGQRGTDVRSPQGDTAVAQQNQQVVAGSNLITPIVCTYYDRAISYVAMGIVLKAVKRGFKWTDTTFGDCPYYAFRYLIDIMTSALNGTIPQIQQAPHWFWDFLYAIKQKTVSYKTSQIKYSWVKFNSGYSDDIAFTLGTTPDEYTLFWGVTGGSTVNDIPTLIAPPPYVTQGANALNALFSFYSGQGWGKLIGDLGQSMLDNDTSAFAACYAEIGQSFYSPGALKTTYYSERQVDSPVLAKIASYQTGKWRGWQKAGATAGTSCYTGARISELSTQSWRNKTSPIFKFYNFDEFFEVLSLTLCLALENANSNVLPNVTACPLTPLQVQLILRQNLIPFFNNEFAQDMRLEGPNFVDLLPFTVGPNGASYGRPAMLVPTLFAENVRCARRITHTLKGKQGVQILDSIPVLARTPEKPQLGNYVYGQSLSPLYATGSGEVPVNLIDCSSVVGGITSYLDLNTEPITALITAWNEWIETIQTVLSPLVSLSPAPGAAALLTAVHTNIQRTVTPITPVVEDRISQPIGGQPQNQQPAREMVKRGSTKEFHVGLTIARKRMGAAPVPGSSYFDSVGDMVITSAAGFNTAIYPYISIFVLPIVWSVNGLDDATQQAYQTFQCESIFIERTSANSSFSNVMTATAYERHKQMAAADVKNVTQDGNTSLVQGLLDLEKHDGGGFFTGIASLIGDIAGVPQVRAVATAIGGLTGL